MKIKDFVKLLVWNTTITVCALNGSFQDHILNKEDFEKEVGLFVPTGELTANLIVEDM